MRYDAWLDELRGIVEENVTTGEAREGVSAEVCVNERHLHVARRSEDECSRCGQRLQTGAVGIGTWCSDHDRCNHGSRNFEHGCGEWNLPDEVSVNLYQTHDEDGGPTPQEVWDKAVVDLMELAS